MNRWQAFQEYLDSEDLYYKRDELDDGDVVFRIPQRIKNGGGVNIIVAFSEISIKILIVDIATLEDEEKIIKCYQLFNSLNRKYKFFKFTIDDEGRIFYDGDFATDITDGDFQPDELFAYVVVALKAVNDVYPQIMKILWE